MNTDQLVAFVQVQIPELQPGANKQFVEFIVPLEKYHALAKVLKEHPDSQMDYLFCQTASDRKDGFYVVNHLASSTFRHELVMKVLLTDKVNPTLPTISYLWPAAEFYEREIFDLFGIKFEGHPDLRRLFLEDDWVGYPLRKDYKDPFIIER